MEQLSADLAKLDVDLKMMSGVAQSAPAGDEKDKMGSVISTAVESARVELQSLTEDAEALEEKMIQVVKLFGEQATKAKKGDEVLSQVAQFVAMLESAEKDLVHEEEQAEKKRGRAKTMSAMSPKLPQRAFILDDSCRNSNACPD